MFTTDLVLVSTGRIHSISFDRNRVYRVDHRRIGSDLHTTRSNGGRAAGDGPAHRRGHSGHCGECIGRTAGAAEILRQHLQQPLAYAEGLRSPHRIRESNGTCSSHMVDRRI